MLEGNALRSSDFGFILQDSNLYEGPKCKVCSNAADTQVHGIWYCEECAPAVTPVFVPRIVVH